MDMAGELYINNLVEGNLTESGKGYSGGKLDG
jgi:hypothetical protein